MRRRINTMPLDTSSQFPFWHEHLNWMSRSETRPHEYPDETSTPKESRMRFTSAPNWIYIFSCIIAVAMTSWQCYLCNPPYRRGPFPFHSKFWMREEKKKQKERKKYAGQVRRIKAGWYFFNCYRIRWNDQNTRLGCPWRINPSIAWLKHTFGRRKGLRIDFAKS